MSARKVLGPFVMEEESLDTQSSAERGLCSSAAALLNPVCLLKPNIPTRIVKPEDFHIVVTRGNFFF